MKKFVAAAMKNKRTAMATKKKTGAVAAVKKKHRGYQEPWASTPVKGVTRRNGKYRAYIGKTYLKVWPTMKKAKEAIEKAGGTAVTVRARRETAQSFIAKTQKYMIRPALNPPISPIARRSAEQSPTLLGRPLPSTSSI